MSCDVVHVDLKFTTYNWTGVLVTYIGRLQCVIVLCEIVSNRLVTSFPVLVVNDVAGNVPIHYFLHDTSVSSTRRRHLVFHKNIDEHFQVVVGCDFGKRHSSLHLTCNISRCDQFLFYNSYCIVSFTINWTEDGQCSCARNILCISRIK